MNSVASLLAQPFSSRSLEEKIAIKELGRPTPSLNISQEVKTKSRQFKRNFNADSYKKHGWLCGCNVRNALYCFPCLLFGGEQSWTKLGMTDIHHLNDRVKKHEASSCHMKNVLSLTLLGNVNVAAQLDSGYRRAIELHNAKVNNNRYVLNVIINCIRFCGSFELALRGHDESGTSTNPGVFRGLINFSAELDDALKAHLEKATVFKGTSKTIQNELLQCILEVCQDEITKEIREADFLAIIADETSDVACMFQMVIVYRYIVNCKPVERFWDFLTPVRHDAQSLANCISKELSRHLQGCPEKLIAQAYDGAAVMGGSSRGVQAVIRETYDKASYVHCYAHQLNLIMSNAASMNRNVRIFFANLQGLCTFFSCSPQRTAILDGIVKKRLPRSVPTRWNFHSRSVNTVFEYREELIECMKAIQTGDEIRNSSTIAQASGLAEILKTETFVFWLSFFHRVMVYVDILYSQLQKRQSDASTIRNHISAFEREMMKIRESIAEISSSSDISDMPKKRRCAAEIRSDWEREAVEVCDIIICQAKDRYRFTGHLVASSLFQSSEFENFNKSFPEALLMNTVEVYSFLDVKKLRTELSIVYGMEEFRTMSGAVSLFDFLTQNNLCDTFSECVKLLKVLITIPMTTAEAERCFSTLKRIKTFLRNSMSQERLSALAMLSIERDFVLQIKDFNEKVIDKFSGSKSRRMDFLYK